MTLVDHAFVLLFVVGYPVAGLAGFRRLRRRMAAGEPVERTRIYRSTILGHWLLFAMATLLWLATDRPWAALGIAPAVDWRLGVAAVIVLAAVVALVMQLRRLEHAAAADIARLRDAFGPLAAIVPHSRAELAGFRALSITAGVVEEVLWRGYLVWYLSQFWNTGTAALLVVPLFGLAHAYQGLRQVPAITAVSAVLTALYLLTGTLWAPIVLHAAIDLLQGQLGFEINRRHCRQAPEPARS